MHAITGRLWQRIRTFTSTTPLSAKPRGGSRPRYQQQQQQSHPQHHQQPHPSSPDMDSPIPPVPVVLLLGSYLAVINVAAAGLFWYDKQQALAKRWRVPERQLQLTALLGGWLGGMWAMEKFRHKTTKQAFREPYFVAVALNGLALAGVAGMWAVSPAMRYSVRRISRGLTGM
ncbi:hypothetical protein HDU97_005477 [Phlyctochytrium planicorne]|nr:hypothetical protein HDU97_005477 [Phlyctochytrium planicorne]